MKLELFDVDEFVSINHLQEVTSPVLFQRGDVPHPNGLISNQIFGITTRDRKRKFAYIDLHAHYFQPHVYIALKFLFSGIDSLINGSENYSIDQAGQLVKDPEGDTGLDFIYTNWEKIKWLKKDGGTGGMRDERIALLTKTPKNLIFMDKQIVIPPFYRDIKSSAGGGGETSDLNNYYANIIRFASRNQDKDMFGFTFHATNYSIQDNINKIYQYFRTKLEKKQGMFRKYLMGKTVDNAVRTVITAPTYHANDPDDLMVDYNHAAVPISQLCVELYPFVVSWLKNFFDREFIENKYTKTYWSPDNDTEAIIELDSPETYFNDKFIDTMINRYIKNPESRFDPIELPVKGNKKKYIAFRGKRIHSDSKADVSTIAYRPMTVTDLLYIACCDVSKDKHILVTRYPLLDSFGVFINKINVMSTTKTEVVDINGEIYKWYPKIDFSVPKSEIGCLFDDSLKFSNSYLKGIGGD